MDKKNRPTRGGWLWSNGLRVFVHIEALCVFQDKARRNGSRYGFAFDIPAISGRPLFSGGKPAGMSGSYVIPGQSPMGGTSKSATQNPFSLMARGIRRILPLEKNYSIFSVLKTGLFSGIVSGGCHE